MTNNELMNGLKDIEFCDLDSGRYFRAVAVQNESGDTVVMLVNSDE